LVQAGLAMAGLLVLPQVRGEACLAVWSDGPVAVVTARVVSRVAVLGFPVAASELVLEPSRVVEGHSYIAATFEFSLVGSRWL